LLSVSREAVALTVDDEGPGIPDVTLAMQEGYSTATAEMREMGFGAGMGLPNIRKNADRFDISSEVGRGTRLYIQVSQAI
jgi:serine/threonine-protein kinase RsbT